MAFELNKEKALDVLIWWIEGSDGSIDYREEETVKKALSDMNYSMETYYEDTLMHIGGLSNENLKKLVDRSIKYGKNNYSEHEKQKTIALLHAVAESNGHITDGQQEKIERLKKAFGVSGMKMFEEE